MRTKRITGPAQPPLFVGDAAALAERYQDATGRRLSLALIRQLVQTGELPIDGRDRRTKAPLFDLAVCMDALRRRDEWESGSL